MEEGKRITGGARGKEKGWKMRKHRGERENRRRSTPCFVVEGGRGGGEERKEEMNEEENGGKEEKTEWRKKGVDKRDVSSCKVGCEE